MTKKKGKGNAGVLRFAQDDGEKRATTKTNADPFGMTKKNDEGNADPFGMTKKKGNGEASNGETSNGQKRIMAGRDG